MTPAERKAKLEAAKALMQEVESDELPATPANTSGNVASNVPAAPAKPSTPAATVVPSKAITGPGGDTRVSGQPSLRETMSKVWAAMRTASTPNTIKKAP